MSYVIYTRKDFRCEWCERAATLLQARGFEFEVRALDLDELRAVAQRADMDTIPIIYAGPDLIGGCADLQMHLKETPNG